MNSGTAKTAEGHIPPPEEMTLPAPAALQKETQFCNYYLGSTGPRERVTWPIAGYYTQVCSQLNCLLALDAYAKDVKEAYGDVRNANRAATFRMAQQLYKRDRP